MGILRLATKYEVNSLRKWAVDCLEKLHPLMKEGNENELLHPPGRLEAECGEPIDGMFPLIEVAVSVGVPWIVPHVLSFLLERRLETIFRHPEWDEFPDERKKDFLLTRDAVQKTERYLYEYVVDLHGDHDTVTPEDRECAQSREKTFRFIFNRHVARSGNPVWWNNDALERECSGCKGQYKNMQRHILGDQFLELQELNSLPKLAEMLELREKFFKEVAPGE